MVGSVNKKALLASTLLAAMSFSLAAQGNDVSGTLSTQPHAVQAEAAFEDGEVFLVAGDQTPEYTCSTNWNFVEKPLAFLNTPEAQTPHLQMAEAKNLDSVFGESVGNEALSEARGAASFSSETLGVAVLEAVAVQNVSTGSVTGSNVISDSALGNSTGVISLIQNSGNNVIIQSATLVNLTLK